MAVYFSSGMWLYRAKLVRVIDGDTIETVIDYGFRSQGRWQLRLLGVDTPERGEPGWAECTKYVGDWLTYHSMNTVGHSMSNDSLQWPLAIWTRKGDSFWRWLSEVYCNSCGQHLNRWVADYVAARGWETPPENGEAR